MNGRKRGCRFSFASMVRVLAFLAALAFGHAALAETVEVAPGIQVTKKTYSAPVNEQPFFGFAVKTDAQREADEKFVKALLDATGTREKALEEITNRGWRALGAGKLGEAAQRFNQAFLVDSRTERRLSRPRRGRPDPLQRPCLLPKSCTDRAQAAQSAKMLNADYGRVLLVDKRPKEAQPVLEQAVKDAPDFGDAWINLAWARQQNGDSTAACAAADEAMKRRVHPPVQASIWPS